MLRRGMRPNVINCVHNPPHIRTLSILLGFGISASEEEKKKGRSRHHPPPVLLSPVKMITRETKTDIYVQFRSHSVPAVYAAAAFDNRGPGQVIVLRENVVCSLDSGSHAHP